MSFPDLPDDRKKRGIRQSMRSGYHQVKDMFRRRSSSHQTLEQPGRLSPISIPQSFSGRTTPALITGPPSPLDQPTNIVTPRPLAQDSNTNVNLATLSSEPTTAHYFSGRNTPAIIARPLFSVSDQLANTSPPPPLTQDFVQIANLTPQSPESDTSDSISDRNTSVLAAGPPPTQHNQPKSTPSPQHFTQDSASTVEMGADIESTAPENAVWSRLRRSLRALETSVEVFPPLRSAIGAFAGCLGIVQEATSNREDYEELVAELECVINLLAQDAGELATEPGKGSIAHISQCIKRQVAKIEQKANRGTIRRVLEATQDQEDVMRLYRQIERLFRQLQCDLTMRTKNLTKKHYETTLLEKMSPVDDAVYNSSYSTTVRRRGCTAKTRETIHQILQEWTTDPESEKIYWMNGMAGTGKTTIAYSYCEWLEGTNRLGASFFCSRISSSCRSLSQIVPTLAHQLAYFSPAFRSKLCGALNDAPNAGKLNVMQQFEKLIYQPMLDCKEAMPDSIIVVIDALDECDDSFSVQLLLDVLIKFAEQIPLKFFVASRPEHVIRERMLSPGGTARAIVHLHDIEESIVEEDIKKYLTEAFSSMAPPPTTEQIAMLAKRCRNLFIYAATLVRYIYPGNFHVDSAERLDSMLEAISDPRTASKNKYQDLDSLYTTVLTAVFHPGLDDCEKDRMQRVLWTVVCAKEPMFVATIVMLASMEERQVWAALQSLRSVIHVPENNSLVSTLHASFPEYMLDQSRSKELHCDESETNQRLTHRLFGIMKSELRFNICHLGSSYLNDDQVEDLQSRVTRHISPTLSYSCRYWSSHLSPSPPTTNTYDMLLNFLSNQLLFWMEVLSLCRSIGIGAPMVQEAQTWLRRSQDTAGETQKQLSDARNFVTWFAANPCSRSTPHIYISALPMCAKSNWVYQHYSKRMQGLVNIEMSERDEAVLAIWSVKSGVLSLAMCPDGSRIAAGTADGSIQLYDIHTGAVVLGPLKAHTNTVRSVAFSPDGALIASGSEDSTVIIWDIHTGRIVTGPLHNNTGTVYSVAFSPDGKQLAAGSHDKTVCIYDVFTGAVVLGPVPGHSGRIYSVAFSPDGRHIASGSSDSTIQLWDTSTRVTETFHGHKNIIWMVAFSPDGSKLATCSQDKTIQIWDLPTGTAVGQPLQGHRGTITSIAFSSNGMKLVSGGGNDDGSVMVWDLDSRLAVGGPLRGHTGTIWSVVFSPDGTRVVSGSWDSTIRIWDVQGGNKDPLTQPSRETSVAPIAFSPDHTRFVSYSSGGGLHTWDMYTGTIILPTIEASENLGSITSAACSLDQQRVAAGASDFAIYVWNTPSGTMISQPLKGHTASIRCLAFSPDDAFICSGSDDSTVIVWNVEAGAMIGQPYGGHMGSIHLITYSPDGTRIASGATDRTVRVWDPATGKLLHTFSRHWGAVESIAFSPDGNYIISGSADKYIRKWDLNASTGTKPVSYCCGKPVYSVAFFPDDTRVVVGTASTICIFNPQITELLTELSLPDKEKVHWVGVSREGNNIISVTTSAKENVRYPTNSANHQPPQRSNIIRVWRAGSGPDHRNFSSETGYWSHERDGRILSPEGFVVWVPPDLLPYLTATPKTYYNPFVLSSKGVIDLGYKDLCIGERWTECYVHKG